MRSFRRVVAVLGLVAGLLSACGGGSGVQAPPATGSAAAPTGATGDSASGPSGATGTGAAGTGAIDACALVNEGDASGVLGGPVELVPDPLGEGLINAPIVGSLESVCYFRPVPDDGDRMVATVVFTPGSVSEDQLQEIVASGSSRGGGMNYDLWVVEQTMIVSKGDTMLVVRATTEEGSAPDESAEFELALLAAGRLPTDPPGADNLACELLTSEMTSAALGGLELVPSGGAVLDDQTTACGFTGASEPAIVVLYLTSGPSASPRFHDFSEQSADSEDFTEISGLGDAAFQSFPGLTVLVGDTLVDVNVTNAGDADYDAARTLVEDLVAEL